MQLDQEIEDFRQEKGPHKVLSALRRPMQSRVGAGLVLSVKNAVSRSRAVAGGRNQALAAGAADIAGKCCRRTSKAGSPFSSGAALCLSLSLSTLVFTLF